MKLNLIGFFVSVLLIMIAIIMNSCTTYRCYPSKRSKDYAVLKEGGTIAQANDYRRTTLISIRRTMKGYKHLFVTDESDSIYLYLYPKLEVGECYLIKDYNFS